MQTTRRLTIPILALALLTGCALKSGRTPEGLAADYGVRIARTVGAAQQTIGTIGKTSTLPEVKRGAIAALRGLEEVNQLGLQLADKLEAVRLAREAGQPVDGAVNQAAVIIDQIDAAVALGVIPKLGDHPELQAGLQAARAVTKLILEIQFQLGRQS